MPRVKKTSRKKKTVRKSARQVVTPIVARYTASFPVVAVGASAGGFEAFINLLRSLPKNPGLALIFIPHLDPTHESAMVDLLARTTEMPVEQASDGTVVKENRLFVLPPNSDMTISGGVLRLIQREAARGHHMPVDTFFSLPGGRSDGQCHRSHPVRHRQRRYHRYGRHQKSGWNHLRAKPRVFKI